MTMAAGLWCGTTASVFRSGRSAPSSNSSLGRMPRATHLRRLRASALAFRLSTSACGRWAAKSTSIRWRGKARRSCSACRCPSNRKRARALPAIYPIVARLEQYDIQSVVKVFEKQALTDERVQPGTCDRNDLNTAERSAEQRGKTPLLRGGQTLDVVHDERAERDGRKMGRFSGRPLYQRYPQPRPDLRKRSFNLNAGIDEKDVRVESMQRRKQLHRGIRLAVDDFVGRSRHSWPYEIDQRLRVAREWFPRQRSAAERQPSCQAQPY